MARKSTNRTIEDIEWVDLEIDGKQEKALNRGDAALYIGRTAAGLDGVLKRYPDVKKYVLGTGKSRYYLKHDLDKIKRDLTTARPVE